MQGGASAGQIFAIVGMSKALEHEQGIAKAADELKKLNEEVDRARAGGDSRLIQIMKDGTPEQIAEAKKALQDLGEVNAAKTVNEMLDSMREHVQALTDGLTDTEEKILKLGGPNALKTYKDLEDRGKALEDAKKGARKEQEEAKTLGAETATVAFKVPGSSADGKGKNGQPNPNLPGGGSGQTGDNSDMPGLLTKSNEYLQQIVEKIASQNLSIFSM